MPREVWKYELSPEKNIVHAPMGAQWLYAAAQRETAVAYALIEPENGTVEYTIWVCGTGDWTLPETGELRPLGLISLHGGALMFHAFLEVHE